MRALRCSIVLATVCLLACEADGKPVACNETSPCGPDSVCRFGQCADSASVRLSVSAESAGADVPVAILDAAGTRCDMSTCDFAFGDPVVLRAGDAPGVRFSGWSGSPACVGTAAELVIDRLEDDLRCIANYTRRARVSGFIAGTPDGSGPGVIASSPAPSARCAASVCEVDFGEPVKLTAASRWGERFVGWSGQGCGDGDTPELIVTPIDGDITCVGTFVPRVTVKGTSFGAPAIISATSSTRGAVCDRSSCLLDRGGGVTLVAPPVVGHRFMGWSGTTRCVGWRSTLVLDSVDQAQVCVATYVKRVNVRGSANGAQPPPRVTALSTDAFAVCEGSECEIDRGGSAMLLASSARGYRLTGWSGAMCEQGTGPALQLVEIDSDVACVAEYRLGIAVMGAVVGAVGEVIASSSTPGAVCMRGGCVIDAGGDATLTAPTIDGHRFMGWEGDPGCESAALSITFPAVAESRTCFARYAPRFEVSGFATPLEGGSVRATADTPGARCSGAYCRVDGGSVQLEAIPNPGYRFAGFSGGPGCTGMETVLRVVEIAGNLRCQANFVGRVNLVARAQPESGGSVTIQPEGDAACLGGTCTIDRETRVNLTAMPSQGYTFIGWSGCAEGAEPSVVLPPLLVDTACTANFTAARYRVSTAVTPPTGGRVVALGSPGAGCDDGGCTVSADGVVTLTAMAAPGHRFVGWSGCATGTDPVLVRSALRSDELCRASFEPRVTVTTIAVPSAGGTTQASSGAATAICSPTSCEVSLGESVRIAATRAPGYRFVGWTGCTISETPTLELPDVRSALRCQANFEAERSAVSAVVAIGSGSVTASVDGVACPMNQCQVAPGVRVTLSARPDGGHQFAGWRDCPVEAARDQPENSVISAVGGVTCRASFDPLLQVSVAVAQPELGRVSVAASACEGSQCAVVRGSQAVLRAMPTQLGASFTNWTGAGCPLGSSLETSVTVGDNLHCIGNFVSPPPDAGTPIPALAALERALELPLLRILGQDAGMPRANVDAGVPPPTR